MSEAARSDTGWQPWAMGWLDDRPADPAPAEPTAAPAGFDEGYAQGHAAGYAEAEQQWQAQFEQAVAEREQQALAGHGARLDEAVAALHSAREALDAALARQIGELGLAVGRQLALAARRADPDAIVAEVDALLAAHPDLGERPMLYLNVDDLEIVEQQLGGSLEAAGWQARGDVNLARGDCRVDTATVQIEADFDERWQRLRALINAPTD